MKSSVSQDKKSEEKAAPKKGISFPAPGNHIASDLASHTGASVAQRSSVEPGPVIQMYRPNQTDMGNVFLIKDPRNPLKEVAARFVGFVSSFGGYNFEWHAQIIRIDNENDIIGPIGKSQLRPRKTIEDPDQDVEDVEDVADMELSSPDLSHGSKAESAESVKHTVISGHGAFNENHLQSGPKRSDGKKAKFTVPEGITIIMYAPPGAALENLVANAVESGNYPTADEVMLENNVNYKRQEVPTPYPYVFNSGEEIINYTVSPPNKLKIVGNPTTVDGPTSLFDVISGIRGPAIVHYACCSSAYPASERFKALFDYRGFNVCFKKD